VTRKGSTFQGRVWSAFVVVAALAAALAAGIGRTATAAGTSDVAKAKAIRDQVQTFTLANGLRFIVLERHDVPIFSYRTFVNTGAVDEHPGITGIAHMFEHMAFKGTTHIGTTDWEKESVALALVDRTYAALMAEKRKGAEADSGKIQSLESAFDAAQKDADQYVISNAYSKLVEQAGANALNAGTGVDYTRYMSDFPSNKLELWAMTEGDRLTYPVLREFFKERSVVQEERRMRYEATGSGRLFLDFLDNSFDVFPYKTGAIGRMEDLQSFSREDAQAFHDAHYVAKNIVIAVVGDVKTAEVKKLAEKYFSAVPDRDPAPPVSVVEPPRTKEHRIVHDENDQPIVFFGYRIPSVKDPKWHAYEALADVLGSGRSGRLYTKLVKEDKVAVALGVSAGFPGDKYPNLMFGYLVPAAGVDPDSALAATDLEISRFVRTAPITEEELAGFKTRALAEFWGSVQNNGSTADRLVYYEGILGDWRRLFSQVDEVNALTVSDVMNVAKDLRADNRTVGILRNRAQ
jgi:predicted Zn-dependent peptidase